MTILKTAENVVFSVLDWNRAKTVRALRNKAKTLTEEYVSVCSDGVSVDGPEVSPLFL